MFSFFLASAKPATVLMVVIIVVAGIVALPAFYAVHCGLTYCYLQHAHRFCRKNGYELLRWRCGPAFDKSGVKTEFSVFEIDCRDAHGERKLVRLLLWLFGIRKVLCDEKYPEPIDDGDVPPSKPV